ncbi:MAG: efflux RND transporter periplasmic adaptor subunit [Planctomycetota bacterium]|nr:efflux RND transporter periplasmic adaptor subunit [Planctomycetota bacterium]
MPTSPHVALLLAVLVCACSVQASSEDASPDDPKPAHSSAVSERQAPKVRTAQVERRTMRRVLETTAAAESLSEIDVVAEAGGRVIEVAVQEGARVATGDLLSQLDDRDQRTAVADAAVAVAESNAALERSAIAEQEAAARVRSAELNLEQAERDHARNVKLVEGDKTSALSTQALEAGRLARDSAFEALAQAKLAEAKSAVDTRSIASALERAKLTAQRAERDLERTAILAPIDGVVAMRSIEPGRNVSLGQVVFNLVDPDRLRVIFYRPQRELQLFSGDAVSTLTATTEAAPGAVFQGRIERVSPVIDRTSGAFRVTARLAPESTPDEDGRTARLLPGMLLRLAVVTGVHEDTLVVPKRAVRREGSSVFVLAVEAKGETQTVRRVGVTEGYSDDEYVEIKALGGAELAEGTVVITVGGRDLEDGDLVQDEGSEQAATPDAEPDAEPAVGDSDAPNADQE